MSEWLQGHLTMSNEKDGLRGTGRKQYVLSAFENRLKASLV